MAKPIWWEMGKDWFCDFSGKLAQVPQIAMQMGMDGGSWLAASSGGVPAWQGGQVMVGQDQDDGFVAEG